jgi:Uma2 family endonuclease
VLPEPELRLRGDKLSPDLAAWRIARLPVLPKTSFIQVAPDWVCEILTPSTQSIDRFTKMPAYAAAGVGSLWLLSVINHSIEAYRLGGGTYELVATHRGDRRVRVEPFAEFQLELATLWP